MLETEERLFDKYKRVDNICRDMFSSQSVISQYITEMKQNSYNGRYAVPSWDRDYRRLKRVRWIRNQIAHESSATDCNEEDVAWLETFYSRILEREDPLALLAKTKQERLNSPPQREHELRTSTERRVDRDSKFQKRECFPEEAGHGAYRGSRYSGASHFISDDCHVVCALLPGILF
ncbi:hypothetical protein IMSAG049_01374 [Clostridiales bacterium]|nr:hypothetical protein IMSAG049_01374 [Clostridiales bacterium]